MTFSFSLTEEPYVGGLFVRASFDDVATYFRCHYNYVTESGEPSVRELRGSKAEIGKHFGFDVRSGGYFDWLPEHYPLRGSQRISIVACNPEFVFVESFCNHHLPFLGQELNAFLGADTFEFWSAIADNPMDNVPVPYFPEFNTPHSMLNCFSNKVERLVFNEVYKGKWDFIQKGEPLHFEDVENYRKRLKKDRLNREILLSHMRNLGLDPVSIFQDRKFESPILFSSDLPGEEMDFADDVYQDFVHWEENIGFL